MYCKIWVKKIFRVCLLSCVFVHVISSSTVMNHKAGKAKINHKLAHNKEN